MDKRSHSKYYESTEDQTRPHKLYTLVFPISGTQVLLGMKKRGFGKEKYNGFGGKVEAHESIEQGAIRELEEESGLQAQKIKQQGVLFFYFESDPLVMEVHLFVTKEFLGNVEESEEMRPEWFSLDQAPFEQMWADDAIWWPLMLQGKMFVGRFWFKSDMKTIERNDLRLVEQLGE